MHHCEGETSTDLLSQAETKNQYIQDKVRQAEFDSTDLSRKDV